MKSSVRAYLYRQRQAIERDLAGSPDRWYFSPAAFSQYQVTLDLIRRYARGRLIDLGCGDMPFRGLVQDRLEAYDSLDVAPRSAEVTYQGDIQDMRMIAAEAYDTALCIEVLEHVPDPFQAAREIWRILTPGGHAIVSVPHLSRLHDEPHDYYRFTRHGLRRVLEQAGFQVIDLRQRGGLFSFLGHQVSTVLLTAGWGVPVVRSILWWCNRWLVIGLSVWLDGLAEAGGLFPMGYSVAAVKPGPEAA